MENKLKETEIQKFIIEKFQEIRDVVKEFDPEINHISIYAMDKDEKVSADYINCVAYKRGVKKAVIDFSKRGDAITDHAKEER